ncbi:MAG: hypothetical protein ABI416_03430 [Ginsengibacter sp.]
MTNTFLFRLIVLTFFCMASLAIKSETTSCKLQCPYATQKATIMDPLITSEVHASPIPHDEGFFIKI